MDAPDHLAGDSWRRGFILAIARLRAVDKCILLTG